MIAAIPPLARVMAAKLAAHLDVPRDAESLSAAFTPAIAAMDVADRVYRESIETILEAAPARAVLETMAAYRHQVGLIRDAAATEIRALFERAGRTYGDYDPLDPYTPSTSGLAHVDGVRVSDLGDRARADVARLRGEANARIAPHIGANGAGIVAEKKHRMTAFKGALHAVVVPIVGGSAQAVSPVIDDLAALADGFY